MIGVLKLNDRPRGRLLAILAGLLLTAAPGTLEAQATFYQIADELTVTRGQDVVARLPCERIALPRNGGWPSHHIGGHVGRTHDGQLYAALDAQEPRVHYRNSAWQVLVHQKRYPRDASELVARVSSDRGKSWQTDRYRVNFGFGYSGSLVLEDGTILTVTGSADGNGGPRRSATAIRWRLLTP